MKASLKSSFICIFFLIFRNGQASCQELFYAFDQNSKISVENVEELVWKKYSIGETIKFGYNSNATVWCKLVLGSSGNSKGQYWTFDNIHLDSIIVFHNQKLYAILGDRTRFHSPFLHIQAIDLSEIPIQDKVEVIASVKKQWSSLDFGMDVNEGKVLDDQSNIRLAIVFSILGFSTLLLLLTIYIYIQTYQKTYFLYILYSLMGLVYLTVNMGIIRAYVFPEFTFFSEVRIYSSTYWFLLLGLLLSEILKFMQESIFLFKSFKYIQVLVFFMSILCIVFLYFKLDFLLEFSVKLIFTLFLFNLIFVSVLLVKCMLKRKEVSLFVFFFFFPHLIWGLNMILFLFNLVQKPIKTDWLSWLIIYEMFFFGWILIKDYVRAFQKNKALQQRIIQEERMSILSIEKARLKERMQVSELLHDKISMDIAHTLQILEMGQQEKARSYLYELGKNIRNLSHSILPRELEEGALYSAINTQVEIISSQLEGIQISFDIYDFPSVIDIELSRSAYLMIMELIQNSIKHAKTRKIHVEFFGYSDSYVMTVSDEGKGFKPENSAGFGLKNIERRVLNFGGYFEIISIIDQGTTAIISIPITNTHQ